MFSRQNRWWSCHARWGAPSWRPWCSGSWPDHGRDPGGRCVCSSETSGPREDPEKNLMFDRSLTAIFDVMLFTYVKLWRIFSVIWKRNHDQAVAILLPDHVSEWLCIDHNCGDDNQDGDKEIPEHDDSHWPSWYLTNGHTNEGYLMELSSFIWGYSSKLGVVQD